MAKDKLVNAYGLYGKIQGGTIRIKHGDYDKSNRKHRQLGITHLQGGAIRNA